MKFLNQPQRGSVLLLTILMVIMLSLQMAVLSLVAVRSVGEEGMLSSQSQTARFAAESSMAQLANTLYSYLGGHTADEAATAYAQGAVSASALTTTNPDTGATDTTSIMTSAWIAEHRGDFYHLVGRGTNGSVDLLVHRWIRIKPPTASSYDCSVVENQVLAGNIASVADADLIAYAQNNCMLHQPTGTLATLAPTTGSAGDPSCSSGSATTANGSGTQLRGNTSGGCQLTFGTTYSEIRLLNISGSTTKVLTSYTTPLIVNFGTITDGLFDGSTASGNLTLKINSTSCSTPGSTTIKTGSGDDTVSINTDETECYTKMNGGNDTIYLGGTLTGDADIHGNAGNDTFYVNNIVANGNGYPELYGEAGNDTFYFNNGSGLNGTDPPYITDGGGGNDVVMCLGIFGGSCGSSGSLAKMNIRTGNGNDIIGIDAIVTGGIIGGDEIYSCDTTPGSNIVYVKGINGSVAIRPNCGAPAAGSLMIVGGNRTNGSITAVGSGNVILLKSGSTTSGTTISGFAKTLTY